MILGRRTAVLTGGAFLCLRPVIAMAESAAAGSLLSTPPGKKLGFAVMRKNSKIGEHVLTFDDGGNGNLTVHVAVELRVGVGPIALFKYKHNATETWVNGQLYSLATETNDDGTPNKVRGEKLDAGFQVEGTKAKLYTAPPDSIPATHWNRKQLDHPWINTQDGRLLRPGIAPMGPAQIPTASGAMITANHFQTSGDAQLETFYDDSQNWAGLSFKAGDGSDIVYERM
jgi:hypothetical protein